MLEQLREQSVQRHHTMTGIKRNGTTMLSRCTTCGMVVFTIDGIVGGTANVIDCTSTINYETLPHYETNGPDLGYSIGPDNNAICPDCGRGSTIVGKSCYACGYRPSRPYTVTNDGIPPNVILHYETYETRQYDITEHIAFVDDVKLRYCTRTERTAIVRDKTGTRYNYVRTDKKHYTGPCGTTNVKRHVYINDDDDDNPKFLYTYTCPCKCRKTR